VRLPDISFVRYDSLPDEVMPEGAIPAIAPDLAIEVISKSNTAREITIKIGEYFSAGARAVWVLYPKTRTMKIYSSPADAQEYDETGFVDGGEVLPGFQLSMSDLFERFDRMHRRNKKQPA